MCQGATGKTVRCSFYSSYYTSICLSSLVSRCHLEKSRTTWDGLWKGQRGIQHTSQDPSEAYTYTRATAAFVLRPGWAVSASTGKIRNCPKTAKMQPDTVVPGNLLNDDIWQDKMDPLSPMSNIIFLRIALNDGESCRALSAGGVSMLYRFGSQASVLFLQIRSKSLLKRKSSGRVASWLEKATREELLRLCRL